MNDLPRLMLVTQRQRMKPDFKSALAAALRGGARLIQLREKDLPGEELAALAADAARMCREHGALLLLNNAPHIARTFGAGLHLPENAPPVAGDLAPCGISVHSLEAAQRAARQGANYLVFGPVFETASHPGATPAGLEKLREVCAAVAVPVFAIGGVTAHSAKECLAAGAHGVAVIGAAWDADDVESAVRTLVLATDEHR